MDAPGRIVVLNGTSSAGKTSIATAFQKSRAAAGEFWLVVALDDYLAKFPARWVEVGTWVGSLAGDGVRLETRGDRAIGLVRGQADVVHRFPAYATELDTTAATVDAAVQRLEAFLNTHR